MRVSHEPDDKPARDEVARTKLTVEPRLENIDCHAYLKLFLQRGDVHEIGTSDVATTS